MQIIPVHIKKEIEPSDDISKLILESTTLETGDVLVVAQKIISKQEGRLIDLKTITPSLLSEGIGAQYRKDPKIIELILSESKRIIRMQNGILVVETNHGFICANAGIDESNVKEGNATLLPIDSDLSAQRIRQAVENKTKKNISVIISDTFGRPFRMGQTNYAIGISGLPPIIDYSGTLDSFKKILRVTAIAIADELSSAAELVMKKTSKSPVVIIRDYSHDVIDSGIHKLIRSRDEDLFR